METLLSQLDHVFLGSRLRDWLLAGAAFGMTFLVMPFIRGRIRAFRLKRTQVKLPALDLLVQLADRTSILVKLSVALYFAERLLALPDRIDRVFDVIIVLGIAVQLALWSVTALSFGIEQRHRRDGTEPASTAAVGVLMFVGRVVIWAIFALLALDNLGINITALVAGMGVGGIAIALAVQTVLGDLFASMSIALDKPFAVGDHLRVDDVEGNVEYVGIKSTHLRSLSGEQVILSNADILKSRVHNLGRMPERRVMFRFGVTYETSPEQLERVSDLVKGAVETVPGTRFMQCPLISLGADSLEFELIFFVLTAAHVGYGVTIGEVNKGIFRALTEAGISFAYPTRRLLLEQTAP